jgi:DNA-binding MarR family transcriptional regulator
VDRKAPSTTSRYEALLQLLRTADVIWNASRLFFQEWDLSPSQFNVLNLLESNPEGLSQTDLGRQLITHRSNVTGLVDRLEKRGLVQRKEAIGDRRAYRVVLTRKGSMLLRGIFPRYYQKADHVWNGVSGGRISDFLTAMDHVARNAADATKKLPDNEKEGSV